MWQIPIIVAIQAFDSNGDVKRIIGSIGSTAGSFANPQSVAVDKAGRLLVADTRNHRIQIFQTRKFGRSHRRIGR